MALCTFSTSSDSVRSKLPAGESLSLHVDAEMPTLINYRRLLFFVKFRRPQYPVSSYSLVQHRVLENTGYILSTHADGLVWVDLFSPGLGYSGPTSGVARNLRQGCVRSFFPSPPLLLSTILSPPLLSLPLISLPSLRSRIP